MNRYDPNIHHRRTIRLKGYDYSQKGLYFITICIKNRESLIGEVHNKKMVLNDAGKMIEKWYYELENKYSDIKCHEKIVMPNHFHCIIENVGTDLRVCPNKKMGNHITDNHIKMCEHVKMDNHINMDEHIGSPLPRVIQWFKTMTTNEYIRGVKNNNWQPFNGKLWQRNYWEHIIRNEKSYQNISEYIIKNPLKWNDDRLNTSINELQI